MLEYRTAIRLCYEVQRQLNPEQSGRFNSLINKTVKKLKKLFKVIVYEK